MSIIFVTNELCLKIPYTYKCANIYLLNEYTAWRFLWKVTEFYVFKWQNNNYNAKLLWKNVMIKAKTGWIKMFVEKTNGRESGRERFCGNWVILNGYRMIGVVEMSADLLQFGQNKSTWNLINIHFVLTICVLRN